MPTSELDNKIITFDISKNMKCIKKLGQGGTGSTYLFLDESVDMYFAIKKYTPINESDREAYFTRFIDEIKILFKISHENIVRVYNYYLYPEAKTGYIQMEYVEGDAINKVNPTDFGKTWNDYFVDVINAFDYLYDKGIIHRDIRASNFLVDNNSGTIKIIDFGFGKTVTESDNQNSICLNWPATVHPEEVVINRDYTYSTEIYYIGEMFKHLVKDDDTFLYNDIIKKMLEYSPENRYSNYKEIKQDISNDLLSQVSFNEEDKIIYINFAEELSDAVVKFTSPIKFVTEPEKIRASLEKIVRISSLEEYVQNNKEIISSFVDSSYRYKTSNRIFKTSHLIDFYKLFIKSNEVRKKIIIDSIFCRLRSKPVEVELYDDELPF